MEFFELIQKRHSIRKFLDKPVAPELIERILQAVNRAPSAGNLQAFEIFLVQGQKQRAALAQAAFGQEFLLQAPVSLVFCTHPARSEWRYSQRGTSLYTIQDATIACTFAMLAAVDLGLGTVWVGAFDEQEVSRAIGDPPGLYPVAILPVGYPADQPVHRSRRTLDELVHRLDES
ncbi:MAG: nfnB [Chloroflexi bacterium]|nr:nfnB [Chloroflexota bacterium]